MNPLPEGVNIPPLVRFVLYCLAAVAVPTVSYCVAKGWAGEPELILVGGYVSLVSTLAAAKTPVKTPEGLTHG